MREAIEHVWARNTDPDRHGKQGRKSFRGMAAYSYATVVACKYPDKNGDGGVCVFAGEGIWDSTSTMRHKRAFQEALPRSWTRIWVDLKQGYGCSHGEALTSMPGLRRAHEYGKTCVPELAEKVKNAKSYVIRAKAWKEFQHKRERVNSLGRFLKRADDLLPSQYGLDWQTEDANLARWAAKVAERRRARVNDMTKSFEEQLVDWRARKRAKLAVWNRGFYLRMSRDKKYVETSHGAIVPVGDARKLFKLCAQIRRDANGSAYSPALAVDVGPYTLQTIEPNGDCVVGCHTLKYEEMEALHLANPEPEET